MINPELNGFLEVWNNKWSATPPDAKPKDRRMMFEFIAEQMRAANTRRGYVNPRGL